MDRLALHTAFNIETGATSHKGCIRAVNEDSYLAHPDHGLWLVSDGMGGHHAGDFASRTIVQNLLTFEAPACADLQTQQFLQSIEQAHQSIRRYARNLNGGVSGATLAALLANGREIRCIWAGDSRIYRLRERSLSQLTTDHTEVEELLRSGYLSQEQAQKWPRQHVVTRAIGVFTKPKVECYQDEAELGDIYLLCSDGLTSHLDDEEITEFLLLEDPPDYNAHLPERFSPTTWAQKISEALVARTLERGARDNVTALVLRYLPPSPHPPPLQWRQRFGGSAR